MDHRNGPVHARSRGPVPGGVPALKVAVVGAGIAGTSAAFFLHERGADVVLLDRGEVSGATTGLGEGNVLASDKAPGADVELALAGRALWVQLGERFPAARVARKGALVLGARADELATGGEDVDDARGIEPALAPGTRAVLVEGELQVDPGGLTRALASELPDVRTHATVTRIEPGAGVVLDGGERVAADHVVLAGGPWSAPLARSAGLHLPVAPRKGHLLALAAPPGLIRRKLYEAAYLDAVRTAGPSPDAQVAAVVEQTLDGDEVLVGSSRERAGFDPAVDEAVLAAMLERAARWVPRVRELARTRAWVGFRPWLPDGLPAIGPSRAVPGLSVSTGHEGAGVGLGPVSGRLLAGALLDGTRVPAEFDPDRFQA